MTFVEALGELGVGADASAEVIRAAYLKLLRVRKPDSDPEGFRRLREAYEFATARPVGEDEVPVAEPRNAELKRALELLGRDPLRALKRIQLLDAAFQQAPGDEEVTLLLLEELVAADLGHSVPGVLAAHRPAESERPWEWTLRMVERIAPVKLMTTLTGADPVIRLKVAWLLLKLRDANAIARSLSVDAMRDALDEREADREVIEQLERLRDALGMELWLLATLTLLGADKARELAALPEADLMLLGGTLRASAPDVYGRVRELLPAAASAELPGDPAEEPAVRYLRHRLTFPSKRLETLGELARRVPGDPSFTLQLVQHLAAAGQIAPIAQHLAAHAGATRSASANSPVWAWAVEHCATLMKVSDPAPAASELWNGVMMAWALAASGRDADEAARILWVIVTSTPEAELLIARKVLLVAVLEVCARSMVVERARLLEWLWFFVVASDVEFSRGHERQVLDRTMDTVLTGLRGAIADTHFVRPAAVAELPAPELLTLRGQVLRRNASLKPAPQLPPAVKRLLWALFWSVALLVFWGVAALVLQWTGGWVLGLLAATVFMGLFSRKKS